AQYIAHRIKVAGGDGMLIFDSAAVDEIFRYSDGIPRLINILCDNALMMAYMKNTSQDVRGHVEDEKPAPDTQKTC
ncbi:MAG: hypothetical protein AAB728_03490, partial [Patescibacteria group bacterium]